MAKRDTTFALADEEETIGLLPYSGKLSAPVLVVCDPAMKDYEWDSARALSGDAGKLFAKVASECGFDKSDFVFAVCCPPIPEAIQTSDKKTAEFVMAHRNEFLALAKAVNPKLIIFLGKWPGRMVLGRAVQIMKSRGSFQKIEFPGIGFKPVLPMLSTRHVLQRPEMHDIFRTDFKMAESLRQNKWKMGKIFDSSAQEKNYRWCTDLSDLLANPPQAMSVDTETTGLDWFKCGTDSPDAVKILTIQICTAPGDVRVIPTDTDYYPELSKKKAKVLINQARQLLENPNIRKSGHNIKYDTHVLREALGIYIDYNTDTQLMAFVADENMQEKSLDECIRRWVPEMAGYNDVYNKKLDKTDMRSVSHEDMLGYGGGDADGSFRLAGKLTAICKADKRQWNTYQRIILPAIKAFCDPVELYGVKIDTKKLSALQKALTATEKEMYDNLIAEVPAKIKQRHAEKGLKFTRDTFTRDILFGPDGLRLRPRVFTNSTANLPDKEKIPSVSTKQHLPYFQDEPFVSELMEYIKLQKLRSTYVGVKHDEKKNAPTGFWQYINCGEIHPSYMLHRVVTGRTSSANPNGQNFPKRGKGRLKDVVKAYRNIFVARPGYVLIETDLSQAELRIAAWEANERTMLKIYRQGGDIHAMTAAHTMGLSLNQFMALDEDVIEQNRFQAKAVGFGFLYGMWWKKFKTYAKTDYGLEFTDKQAQELREAFFDLYPGLENWHMEKREFVKEHGYVRALHGAIRHLPSINSSEAYIKQECERQAINSTVQRFASDLGLMAMIRLTRDADPDIIRPIMFVHDALVLEVREEYAQEAIGWTKFYMESPPLEEWFKIKAPIPIVADVGMGPSLGQIDKCKAAKIIVPDWYNARADRVIA